MAGLKPDKQHAESIYGEWPEDAAVAGPLLGRWSCSEMTMDANPDPRIEQLAELRAELAEVEAGLLKAVPRSPESSDLLLRIDELVNAVLWLSVELDEC